MDADSTRTSRSTTRSTTAGERPKLDSGAISQREGIGEPVPFRGALTQGSEQRSLPLEPSREHIVTRTPAAHYPSMPDTNSVLASATVVLALATVALVVATIAYALAARDTVVEMRLTRGESIRPVLALTPEALSGSFALARLSKIGPGAARNIRGVIRRTETGSPPRQNEVTIPLLLSGAHHEFFLDLNEAEGNVSQTPRDVAARGRIVSVDLTYEDALGRSYKLVDEVGWADMVERLFPVGLRLQPDIAADTLRELTKLREAVERLSRLVEGLKSRG
jgi:hypothetical protein